MDIDRTSFCKPMAKKTNSNVDGKLISTNYSFAKAGITVKNAVLFRARKFAVFTTPLPHPLSLNFGFSVKDPGFCRRLENRGRGCIDWKKKREEIATARDILSWKRP